MEQTQDDMISVEDVEQFAHLVGGFMEANYRADIGKTGLAQWFSTLQGKCTMAQLAAALARYATETLNGRKLPMPSPGEIINRIQGGASPLIAWNTAMYCVTHFGRNFSMKFNDPKIAAVIDGMGGWPKFCSLFDGEDRIQDYMVMRDFQSLYESAKVDEHTPPLLVGAMGQKSRVANLLTSGSHPKVSVVRPLMLQKAAV